MSSAFLKAAALPKSRTAAGVAVKGSGRRRSIKASDPITVRAAGTSLPDSVGKEIVFPQALRLVSARSYAVKIHEEPNARCKALRIDMTLLPLAPTRVPGSSRPGGPTQSQERTAVRSELNRLSNAVIITENGPRIPLSLVRDALSNACRISECSRNYVAILNAMRPKFGINMHGFTPAAQQLEVLKLIIDDPSTFLSFAHAIYEVYGTIPHEDANVIRDLFKLTYPTA